MEKKNIYSVIKFALAAFLPGLFVVMALVIGLIIIASRGDFNSLSRISWRILLFEMFFLTIGFVLMSIVLKDKLIFKNRRGILAGIGSVILLGIFSIFTQGVGLLMIIMLSIAAGMISALGLLPFQTKNLR